LDIPDQKTKEISKQGQNASVDEPILYAGSLISKGQCKAVVCCVGSIAQEELTSQNWKLMKIHHSRISFST